MSKNRSKSKPSTNRPFSMHQLRELSDKIESFGGEDAAVKWLITTPLVRVKYPDKTAAAAYARCTIRSLLKPDEPHNQTARDQLALIMRDLGTPQGEETVRVVAEPVEVESAPASRVVVERPSGSVHETGIVRVVDGIPFTLPALSRDGAEQARVTLTDLAGFLGYKSKQDLERLAERNDADLRHYGVIGTAPITVRRGPVEFKSDEPAYNPDQCILLGLASQTDVGRSIRVRMLDAYKSLLSMFEQSVNQPPAFDLGTIAAVVGAAVSTAMASTLGPMMERLLGAAKPEPQNDPTPPAAARQAQPSRQQEQKRQERFRFPVNRRMGLVKKIKAQISADVDDYSKAIRRLWHELYAEMEKSGVRVLVDVADYQLLHGEQIDYLDWIEQNGHLELAIRCAFALWPERKAA